MLELAFIIAVHSIYSDACCSGTHCHPVPCGEIQSVGDGWHWNGMTFPRAMLRIAPDGECHVCVSAAPICIYLPPKV
jgi:hypothetical protein